MRGKLLIVTLLASAVLLIAPVPGCQTVTPEEVNAAQQQVAENKARTDAEWEKLQKSILDTTETSATAAAAMASSEQDYDRAVSAGDTAAAEKAKAEWSKSAKTKADADKMLVQLRETEKTLAGVRKTISEVEKGLKGALNPDGTINPDAAASTVGALLPPPWNVIVALGAPALIGVVGEIRRRRAVDAANSLIGITEDLRAVVPGVKETMHANEPTIHAKLSPLAKRLVEKRKRRVPPSPLVAAKAPVAAASAPVAGSPLTEIIPHT